MQKLLLCGLKLLAADSLGGSGSRGYGKVAFTDLALDGQPIQADFDKLPIFDAAV